MPISNFTNMTGIADILREANTQTSGWFWTGINLLIFLVLFITLTTGFGWEAALLSAGFVSLILSIFLMYMELQSMWFTGIIAALILIVFIVTMWSRRD